MISEIVANSAFSPAMPRCLPPIGGLRLAPTEPPSTPHRQDTPAAPRRKPRQAQGKQKPRFQSRKAGPVVPTKGLEPPREYSHYALNVARLPIPPRRPAQGV